MTLTGRRIELEVCIDSLASAQTYVLRSPPVDGLPCDPPVDGLLLLRLEYLADKLTPKGERPTSRRAIENGADRLEICGALGLGGGLTPSIGLVQLVRQAHPTVPLMIMIRPRPGDFVYSPSELATMALDIALFRRVIDPPVSGFVLGCLTADGAVDEVATGQLVAAASSHQVTFHRAFDMLSSADFPGTDELASRRAAAFRGLDALRRIGGISRVLTSGLAPSVPASSSLVAALAGACARSKEAEQGSLSVLPGSGISAASLSTMLAGPSSSGSCSDTAAAAAAAVEDDQSFALALRTRVIAEVHASCSAWVPGPVHEGARREGMGFGVGGEGEWGRWAVDGSKVRALREVLDRP